MKEVISHWVFFADDDIRINSNILKKAFIELKKYGFNAINFNCKQKDEITVFPKIKQWGGFGSGTSIVKSEFVKQCEFSRIYEHGYGEDTDFGMQLRNIGCDIIYHPHIELLHLKAPIGGFREKPIVPWEYEVPLPKPAPPLMTYIKKYYTKSQIYGFKTQLFLRYYTKQSIINPIVYIKAMKLRWKKSEDWANFLSNKFPS
jgi:GT2 family glycosyltransferase